VLRLIGHAQAGRPPTEELALQRECNVQHVAIGKALTPRSTFIAGPLPRFDGIVVDTSMPNTRDVGAASPPPSAGGPIRVPPLNPDDVNKFTSLFDKSDVARSGILPGMLSARDWIESLARVADRLSYRRNSQANF